MIRIADPLPQDDGPYEYRGRFAADCFSASFQLDNGNPDVEKRWMMVTLLHPVIQKLRRQNISDTSQSLVVTFPRPRDKLQALCYPMAKQWLDRIIRNRRSKSNEALKHCVHTEIVTAM